VHLALAELRLNDGALRDPAIALMRAGEAVRLTSRRNAPALATLAAAQAATGSPAKAVESVREALKLDPKNNEFTVALKRYEADAKVLRR
jgi:tetratricopeptide (TPR) repeat protein